MAKRRTKKEKIAARNRTPMEIRYTASQDQKSQKYEEVKPIIADGYYAPEIKLPVGLVVSDLTKSGVVTILALIFQFVLSAYLNRGGWQAINGVLHKILSIY